MNEKTDYSAAETEYPAYYENLLHADPSFPIIFHDDHIRRIAPDNFHWHEGVEILCFLEGNGTVFSDELHFSAQAGEIAVINCNHLHATYADSAENGCRYFCLIAEKDFCEEFGISVSQLNFAPLIRDREISSLFLQIAEEWKEQLPFRHVAIKSLVLQIFLLLCRRHLAEDPAQSEPDSSRHRIEMVKNTLRYIARHYNASLTLDDICSATGYSKYYLCRTFREVTGQTMIEHLNLLRCRAARSLLSAGDYTVAECAEACGYNSPSYFARQYKKYIGELPSSRRNKTESNRKVR